MSDFNVSFEQRRRLLAGDYSPLDFGKILDPPSKLPSGCEPGARYVLAWTEGPAAWEDGYGVRSPKLPIWFITVTDVVRHRKGFWRVRFDVTDNRDPDLFLKRGGGYSSVDELRAGAVPDRGWLDARAKAIGEFDHQRRLARFAEEQRERGRERSRARRKRAA